MCIEIIHHVITMKITITEKNTSRKHFVRVVFDAKATASHVREDARGKKTLVIVAPKKDALTRRGWIVLMRSVIQEARKNGIARVELDWAEATAFDNIGDNLSQIFAEAVYMADYAFRTYKTKPEGGWKDVDEVVVLARKADKTLNRGDVRRGVTVATQVNFCRDLANTPGGDMTPVKLVALTRKAIAGTGITLRVLDEKQMRRRKMNATLAVGSGSALQSRFMILEYRGGAATQKPTVLVGKGVTFDSGGIDTKPHPYGMEMMMDMSGGAAVVAAMIAAAKLRSTQQIIGLIPAVENMPSGSSMRPGDIITMMDGTYVEIGHTDAEGRLILADALAFAARYKPARVIAVATLTGASIVALGERVSACFTDNDAMADAVVRAGVTTGDDVWRLPVWDEYAPEIKGIHGDLSNMRTHGVESFGGAITAAMFLKHFAKPYVKNWMHIDIAPTMTTVFDEQLAKGAKGSPVRLLVELLR